MSAGSWIAVTSRSRPAAVGVLLDERTKAVDAFTVCSSVGVDDVHQARISARAWSPTADAARRSAVAVSLSVQAMRAWRWPHDDHREVVGDDVVKLAGYPGPLLLNESPTNSSGFELARALLQRAHHSPPPADLPTDRPTRARS